MLTEEEVRVIAAQYQRLYSEAERFAKEYESWVNAGRERCHVSASFEGMIDTDEQTFRIETYCSGNDDSDWLPLEYLWTEHWIPLEEARLAEIQNQAQRVRAQKAEAAKLQQEGWERAQYTRLKAKYGGDT